MCKAVLDWVTVSKVMQNLCCDASSATRCYFIQWFYTSHISQQPSKFFSKIFDCMKRLHNLLNIKKNEQHADLVCKHDKYFWLQERWCLHWVHIAFKILEYMSFVNNDVNKFKILLLKLSYLHIGIVSH